jgi:hypothetical protein
VSPTVPRVTASSSTSKTDTEQEVGTTAEGTAAAPEDETAETAEAGESGPEAEQAGDAEGQTAAATDDADEGTGDEPAETARSASSNLAAGAAAVVSAGLGLASLTGTWLSDLMSSRQELIGQINTGQTAEPSEQIAAIYGSQWHTTALFNGFFAVAALIAAGVALLLPALAKGRDESPAWVRAVAAGGLALGTLGLLIAAAMWFDVFTDLPTVPEA